MSPVDIVGSVALYWWVFGFDDPTQEQGTILILYRNPPPGLAPGTGIIENKDSNG